MRHFRPLFRRFATVWVCLALCAFQGHLREAPDVAAEEDLCKTRRPIYNTKGVHNSCICKSPTDCNNGCAGDKCDAVRKPTDPSPDPMYPEHWVSEWTMYRVFQNYEAHPPPWANPPKVLSPDDYEVSYGATYYDDSYVPADGDGVGAMMEYYDKRCLPIFPISNTFTCSFISLGNKAYFLTYEEDRPKGMPPCCMFSPYNHPPRRDFIKHLPYSAADSRHLDNGLRAYRYVTPQGIWFAYGYWKDRYLDSEQKYLEPQSFYFSGFPAPPANAPFVSQNYTGFRIEKPNPAQTWDQVAQMCTAKPLPDCQLFNPPTTAATKTESPAADWSKLGFPIGGSK